MFIPKADGRLRPLGVAALEDKILQRALVEVLNAIYETDFLGFSYGFRPGRSPHHALDALAVGIVRKKVNWVLDADFREFFTSLDHQWLEKFLEHRIADKRVLRLIQKWMAAGVIEDGEWSETEEGVAARGVGIAAACERLPALRLRPWAHQWRSRHAHGDIVIVRFADDVVVGFEHREDAERFLGRASRQAREVRAWSSRREDPADRVRAVRRHGPAERGLGKPETFQFLGFTHICAKTKAGGSSSSGSPTRNGCARSSARSKPRSSDGGSAHPRTGTLAGQRSARALQLLRGARQHRGDHAPSATRSSVTGSARSGAAASDTDELAADVAPR